MDQPIIISEHVVINGSLTPLTFHSDGNLRWVYNGNDRCLSLGRDALGVFLEGSRVVIKCVGEGRGGILCCGTTDVMMRSRFVFEPPSEDSQIVWFRKVDEYLNSLGRPKRLFILVNPYGGKKSAMNTFADIVKPLLEDAKVQYMLQSTKYRLHAKELASELDLTQYDGIVCVSGDGILVEVINGLLLRDDWATAIKVALGVIPAGTGNGMAKSLLDTVGEPCSAFHATLTIIRGHKRALDVATISQGNTRFYSVLMLAWGLVADIDIESEKWRWMGSARMDLYAIQRIVRLRKYNGCIHFVPASGFEDYTEKISQKVESAQDLSFCDSINRQSSCQENGYVGPNVDLNSLSWRTIQGPFISVWVHNVPWGGEDAMAAPNAQFADGCLDVILIRDSTKFGLLSLMTELNNGNHVKSPYVSYFKVKALILEPGSLVKDETRGGIIDCDGEVLARGNGTYKCHEKTLMSYESLEVTIDQGLATLFSPPA